MSIFFKILIFISISIFSISIESSAQAKIRGAAREPYASKSEAEKLDIQKHLIIKLKADTDFFAIESFFKKTAFEKSSRGINKNSQKSNPNKQQTKMERAAKVEAVSRTIKLMKKYPELAQLDSKTRKSVLQQARKKEAKDIVF